MACVPLAAIDLNLGAGPLVDRVGLIGGLVAAGVGLTFVSGLALEHHRRGLAVVRLEDPPIRRVFAVLVPASHRSAAVAAMLELLREAAERRGRSTLPA
jgi:DNA-binding transcriptional LysR family regulator